ncbi:Pyoverdine/dityrosine biosynthesis protein-domain-containing protein [Apodospora peruviana]|uniref:Pyoverdine/dityrosine biosynthesis protein-domain-containing protein n=1 Tax=Apodospora peruviana TaxID=516989 RepID=A0AAE0HTU8_9PEZI|nr:Pyoverdine/dityrosine biosynthesis protein-domain-containing protein [Apodospora peruviana]
MSTTPLLPEPFRRNAGFSVPFKASLHVRALQRHEYQAITLVSQKISTIKTHKRPMPECSPSVSNISNSQSCNRTPLTFVLHLYCFTLPTMSQSIINIPSDPIPVANSTLASNLDDVLEISNRILSIVYKYALAKFENTAVKHAAGHPKFMSVVSAYVANRKPVLMCLPAFPFKSANKAYKLFGIPPDKANELALAHLNTMCQRIAAVYKPGAKLTIIFRWPSLRYVTVTQLKQCPVHAHIQKNVKFLAKQMLIRGYAFAGACKATFPNHLRLSIHQSTGEHKVSLSLLDTKTRYTMPWHCNVALMADGQWLSAPMGDFNENPLMEVAHENGRPSYFRQRPPQSLPLAMPIVETADVFNPDGSPHETAISSPSIISADSASGPLASRISEPPISSVTSESVSDREAACESKIPVHETTEENVVVLPKATTADAVAHKAERVSTASNEYGKRLIPHILDDLASTDPDRVIYSVAKSADVSQRMLEISALRMTQAVNKTSWWLNAQIGEATSLSPQTVGYIGPHGLRYVLLTVEGAVAVLKAAGCSFWVQPAEQPLSRLIESCLTQHPMAVLNLPTVDELLDADAASVKHFPYDKTWEEAADETFCVLHTSGSTGLPKPMRWSHALIGTMDTVRMLPPVEGDFGLAPWTSLFEERDTIYSSFPMSHGAGTIMDIMIPSYFAMHCVLGPAGVIPNMDLTALLADHAKIDVWSMVPTLVDELGETPDVLAKFKSAKFICASGVRQIQSVLARSTRSFACSTSRARPRSGFEFRQVGDRDEYEHWCVRNQHGPLFQGIFHTFPDKAEVNLKDLYIKHPTKPGHWAFKGRSDDVVLVYRDLSKILPSFGEMRKANFAHPAATEELLCDVAFYPSLPIDMFQAHANFVEGGCLLVMCIRHSDFDGIGAVTVLRAWAESCRFLQGDQAATCAWLDPDSMNRALPQASLEAERATPIMMKSTSTRPCGTTSPSLPLLKVTAPSPPLLSRQPFALRPAPSPEACALDNTMFLISADKMAQLEADVAADLCSSGSSPSVSDIIQALFWRAAIRARHAIATTQSPDNQVLADATSILEQTVDGRPYFTILTATYMGNLMVVNRIAVPLASLRRPPQPPRRALSALLPPPSSTSSMTIAEVASLIRERNSTLIRPRLFHDAFTLVQSKEAVPDYSQLKYAFMCRDDFGVCVTNLMLFQTGEVLNFGGDVFGTDTDDQNGGPVALRMWQGVQNAHAHRLVVILPMRPDGGVEVLLGTFPEEKEAMTKDGEWMRKRGRVLVTNNNNGGAIFNFCNMPPPNFANPDSLPEIHASVSFSD